MSNVLKRTPFSKEHHILALDLATEQVASKATLQLFKKGENVLKKNHIFHVNSRFMLNLAIMLARNLAIVIASR